LDPVATQTPLQDITASSAPSSTQSYIQTKQSVESPGGILNGILDDVLHSGRNNKMLLDDLLNVKIKEEGNENVGFENAPASPCALKLRRIRGKEVG